MKVPRGFRLACLLLACVALMRPHQLLYAQVAFEGFAELHTEMLLISHAGGGLPEGNYSNSQEALDRAFADGFRYFEVDFNWTSDDKLVLVHDWRRNIGFWFKPVSPQSAAPSEDAQPLSHAEFMALESKFGFTQLDLDALMEWVAAHRDAFIVTDIKTRNIAGLRRISERFPELQHRIIPQIYDFSEYAKVTELGFTKIIFTAYRSEASISDIVNFENQSDLFAVTLPRNWLTPGALEDLIDLRAPLLTHTINDPLQAGWLSIAGVDGLYTDYLLPYSQNRVPKDQRKFTADGSEITVTAENPYLVCCQYIDVAAAGTFSFNLETQLLSEEPVLVHADIVSQADGVFSTHYAKDILFQPDEVSSVSAAIDVPEGGLENIEVRLLMSNKHESASFRIVNSELSAIERAD